MKALQPAARDPPAMKFLTAPEPQTLVPDANALFAVLGLGLLVAVLARSAGLTFPRRRRSRPVSWPRPAPAPPPPKHPPPPADPFDARAQYLATLSCGYERIPVLNGSEARYLPALEAAVQAHGRGARLPLQLPLGEVLRPVAVAGRDETAKAGFHAINAKRVDFAVVDARGLLLAAVEYQGSGHNLSSPAFRDGIKRAALDRAGVPLIEVAADEPPESAGARLAAALRQGTAPPKAPPPATVVPLLPRA